MLFRCFSIAVFLLGVATPQAVDRDTYAREYVRFLVLQLDQWKKEFPQRFDTAVMKPPVESGKLSAAARNSAGEMGDSFARMSSLSPAKDLMTNAAFRGQLDRALHSAAEVNQVMSTQKFPASLQSDWGLIRSTLNSLARVYKLQPLAYLEPPAAGEQVAAIPAGAVRGYIVDLMCAKRGKGMWTNAQCVASCVRDGDKLVLVTEEGKVYQIANQDKITPESYGQVVTLTGKTEGETITIESLKL